MANRPPQSLLQDIYRALAVLEAQAEGDLDSVLSALLLALKSLLAVDDDVEEDVSNIIGRLLTGCSSDTRRRCISLLISLDEPSLFDLLASPSIMTCLLLLEGVLNEPNALSLLQILCANVMEYARAAGTADGSSLVDEVMTEYAPLLVPLKLISWQPAIRQSYPTIEIFVDLLEDTCAQSSVLKEEYFRSLVTGLFHANPGDLHMKFPCLKSFTIDVNSTGIFLTWSWVCFIIIQVYAAAVPFDCIRITKSLSRYSRSRINSSL